MFDIGASELLLIVVVAVVAIGPKDMPLALRTAGRWIGKFRRMSNHFRAGLDAMIRDAELEEMEKKWREQNDAIMRAHPTPDPQLPSTVTIEGTATAPVAACAEAKLGAELPADLAPGLAPGLAPQLSAPPPHAGPPQVEAPLAQPAPPGSAPAREVAASPPSG